MRRFTALLLLVLLVGSPAFAAPLFVLPGATLNFGELIVTGTGAGYFTINAASGATSILNASQIGAPARGDFQLEGNDKLAIVVTLTAAAPVCDATYIGVCVGAPTLSVTHDFGGVITASYCPRRPQCVSTVHVGGSFNFAGTEEGRWTSTVTITANYQ